tara:strand:- start:174 stop:812 length:639 start_codon:yes stop_codon:yes gene_type:complete
MRNFSFVFIMALAPAGWAVDVAKKATTANITSQVLAKGEGYLVQSVRFPFANPLRREALPLRTQVGQVLLHTRLPGGKGTELLHTRTSREWRTRVGSFRHSRVAGVARDKERLYVVVWHAWGYGTYPAFLLPLKQRPKNPRRYNVKLELHVFSLADGKRLHHAQVPGAPEGVVPPETSTEAGPLKLAAGGVDCLGLRLRFKDGKPVPGVTRP